MAVETYLWSSDYVDEQNGTTTTFESAGGGSVDITVSQPDPGGHYVAGGDGFDTETNGGDSAGHISMRANFSDTTQTVTTTIDFAANSVSGADSVSNLSFTLLDLDSPTTGGGFASYQDQVTVLAFDADGNPLTVTMTATDPTAVTISGATATAITGEGGTGGNFGATQTDGNVLVQVEGEVARIEIIYGNGASSQGNPTQQLVGISNLSFDLTPAVICFAEGTLIMTPDGPVAVERLQPGDLVLTLDHGPQPLRWIGSRTVPGRGKLAPVRFAPGTIGNSRALMVSPQHRVLLTGAGAELASGHAEALATALHLVGTRGVERVETDAVTNWNILFDQHEVILAEIAPCESLFLGTHSNRALGPAALEEIRMLFPDLVAAWENGTLAARYCLTAAEARLAA